MHAINDDSSDEQLVYSAVHLSLAFLSELTAHICAAMFPLWGSPDRYSLTTYAGQREKCGDFVLQQIYKESGENERVNETEMKRGEKERSCWNREIKVEREEKNGMESGVGLHHRVTLCSPSHTAPGLLYPPLAINHLILSLLNRQPARPHPN